MGYAFWISYDSCFVISATWGESYFSQLHNISPFIGVSMLIQDLFPVFLQVTTSMVYSPLYTVITQVACRLSLL